MAKRLAYLSDNDFGRYPSHSAETLAALKARAGVSGAAPVKQEPVLRDTEKVTATVIDYVDDIFDLPGEQEDEDRQRRRRR